MRLEARVVWDAEVAGLLAASPAVLLFETDRNLRLTKSGAGLQRLLGAGAAVGAVLTAQVHPDDLLTLLSRIQSAEDETRQEATAEFRLRGPDGSYRWVFVVLNLKRDAAGTVRRLIGCGLDVTSRVVSERARTRSADRLRALLETTDEAVFYMDPELDPGVPVFVSNRVLEISGYAPEHFAEPGFWRRIVSRDDLPALLRALRQAGRSGRASVRVRIRHAEGSHRAVAITLRAIRDGERQVSRVFGTVRLLDA